MGPSKSRDNPDPNLIVEGTRKRKAAQKATDNDSQDPALKKLRTRLEQNGDSPPPSQRSRSPSVEAVPDPDFDKGPAGGRTLNPSRILEDPDEDNDNEIPRKPSKHRKETIVVDSDEESSGVEEVPAPKPKRKGKNSQTSSASTSEATAEKPEESEESQLNRLSESWSSPAYAFFEPTPEIKYVNGRRCHEFLCSAPGCKTTVRRFVDTATPDNSTGNLFKHARKCWGTQVVQDAVAVKDQGKIREGLAAAKTLKDGTITAMFDRAAGKGAVTYQAKPLTYSETRVESVCWVAESMRPASVLEDRRFLRLMKSGRPSMKIPSARTVQRDAHRVFKRVKGRIAELLQTYDGRLSFATDAWTSPNHRPLIAVTVHMEKDGVVETLLLDIVELSISHSGANLAAAFAAILRDYGIEHKLLSVTCDNASSNDVMITELAKIIMGYGGPANRVRCLAHIVNLVVKVVLRQFDSRIKKKKTKGKKKGGDEGADGTGEDEVGGDDSEEGDPDDAEAMAGDIEREEREMDEGDGEEDDGQVELEELEEAMADVFRTATAESLPVRVVLTKLRKLAYAIKNSPTKITPKWYAIIKELNAAVSDLKKHLSLRMMPRDVATRWNSTYDMLKFALLYRRAIDLLTESKAMDLRKYEISEEEWEIVKQLRDVLKIFKTVTLKFSSNDAHLAAVIPAMDKMDAELTKSMADEKLSPVVRRALGLGKQLLDKYYSITDESEVYRIAMVLHPSHKLRYFKKAGWPEDWIKTAEEIVREEFNRMYAHYTAPKTNRKPPVSKTKSCVSDTEESSHSEDESDSSSGDDEDILSELDRYLSTRTVKNISDPLEWWTENKGSYPCLWRMARDYHSIPATSVAVERVFSQGRLLLSHIRNRMSGESTRVLMCLGAWSKAGHVMNSDLQAAVKFPDAEGVSAEQEVDYPIF